MATEQQILTALGVPSSSQQQIIDGTVRLLILDSTAHLDWDWLLPFPLLVTGGQGERSQAYFSSTTGPVVDIFSRASTLIASTDYHFSICEIGFLRAFAQAYPDQFQQFISTATHNNNLRIAGGGITSPDNMLAHGEAIIRNYLIGHLWLAQNCPALPVPLTMWIPDDFGHDPQLPVLMQALGFITAGFERMPGGIANGSTAESGPTISGGNSLATILTNGIIDFQWSASDGSTANAHWLIGGYCQGNNLCDAGVIDQYLQLNFKPSPTPYIYVPVCCDFLLPNANLTQIIYNFNHGAPDPKYGSVMAVAGSFEDYAQLIGFHQSALNSSRFGYGPVFNPNPYYTGCYGSRPQIKILHQKAVRNLLAAEVFSVIQAWAQPAGGSLTLGTASTVQQKLLEAWNLLVPSTHHDYITGTAIPDVFHSEQIGLLEQAASLSEGILRDALSTIAGSINPQNSGSPVAVFNPLGFSRNNELAHISADDLRDASISVSGASYQKAHDGGLLLIASAPALGYQTAYLASANTAPANPVTVNPSSNPVSAAKVVISNGLMSATLQQDTDGFWGLVSVIDSATNQELISPNSVANELLFYQENGDEYIFGNEGAGNAFPSPQWNLADVSTFLSNPAIEIVESGSLRVIVRTSFTYNDGTNQIGYVMEYVMHANEPMLRMRASGAAQMPTPADSSTGYSGYSVLTSFPLNSPIDTVVRGTPYHWTDVMPNWITPDQVYWNGQMFMPTQNFVIPQASGAAMCGLYHADVPAWGISYQWNSGSKSFETNNGVLYGCLWRNGDGHYFNNAVGYSDTPLALGTDPGVHVRQYALRMPSSLGTPQSCGPLKESLAYANPLICVPVAPWNNVLDDSLSLASSGNSSSLITAAKQGSVNPGNLILRVYNPTNAGLPTTITLDSHLASSGPLTATGQNALEQNLGSAAESALQINTSSDTVSFTAVTALTTLAVTMP